MLHTLLSGDYPRSRPLSAVLVLILLALAVTPFALHSSQATAAAVHVCIFIVLVASYDLLLGYNGVVSFAHTMFFGIGGYGAAIALSASDEPSWGLLLLGTVLALVLSAVVAFVIGLLSLRVRALFFAMITLAVAAVFGVLASRLSWLTGGEDGKSFDVPELLRPSYRLLQDKLFDTTVNGKILTYYIIFFACLVLFLGMLRLVNSPFGRVLLAIRENEFRAEALGYRTVIYKTVANCVAAAIATLAGVLLSLWLRYTGPDTTLSFDIMVDILLMVVIGGVASMYGAVIGATIIVVAQNYLQDIMGSLATATHDLPVLPQLFDPERWKMWLGILFILCVYFFPFGIVGRFRVAALGKPKEK